jgi:hypothetical protein
MIMVPQYFLRLWALKTDFDEFRKILCVEYGFSVLHILLFWLLKYPLKSKHASPLLRAKCPTTTHFRWNKTCRRLQHHNVAVSSQNWNKQWTCAKRLGKCCRCFCCGWATSYVLVAVFLGILIFGVTSSTVEASWNVMTHVQKPDFVFRRNGRVHLNR